MSITSQKQVASVYEYELPITLTSLSEGGYLAQCKKLQGCLAEGNTATEAIANIIDVAGHMIDIRTEEGLPVNLPRKSKLSEKTGFTFSIPLIFQPSIRV